MSFTNYRVQAPNCRRAARSHNVAEELRVAGTLYRLVRVYDSTGRDELGGSCERGESATGASGRARGGVP